MRIASVLALGLFLVATSIGTEARAQAVDGFGASDENYLYERPYIGLSRETDFRFQQLSAGEPSPPASPALTLGPFDEALYCFRMVEVFAVDVVPNRPEGGWASHELHVTVHLEGPALDSWWKLVRSNGRTPWSGIYGSREPALSDIRWALPGAREPVVEITIRSDAAGTGQSSREWQHLLVDLRSGAPLIMGEYVTGGAEYGGMPCTWNEALPKKGRFACVWDPPFGDYRCTSTTTYDLPWIQFTSRRCFHFAAGVAFPCPGLPALPSISATEALTAAGSSRAEVAGKLVSTDEGLATVLAVVAPTSGGQQTLVVGSASDRVEFDPSFFLLTVGADGKPQLLELELGYVEVQDEGGGSRERGYDDWHAQPETPPTLELVSGDLLCNRDRFRLFRFVVQQGKARALVLVALDDSGTAPRAQALLVATQAAYRGECGDPLYPATAVSYEAAPEGLPARMAVEPAFKTALIHGPRRYGCPQALRLRWERGEGFTLEAESEDCRADAPTRRVTVADDGSLSFTLEPER